MPWAELALIEPGHLEQRAHAWLARGLENLEAMPDQDMVIARERHHIGSGGQHHEIEVLPEIGLLSGREPSLLPPARAKRHQEKEAEPAAAELPEPALAIRPLRIE